MAPRPKRTKDLGASEVDGLEAAGAQLGILQAEVARLDVTYHNKYADMGNMRAQPW